MNSLQVIHTIESLTLKDEVSCAYALGIRQYVDAITMFYRLAGCIEKVVIVGILGTDSTENVGLTLNGTELAIIDYQFQLIDELGATQIVKLLQLDGHTPPRTLCCYQR